MKKIFKCGLIVAGMLAIAPIGMTAVNTPTPVYAAQKIYGMGKMYTIPKSLRGIWYSKSRKVRITAHTYNGKTVYHQNTKANGKTIKYLDYSNGYTGAKFFKSRSLAKKY